MNYKGYCPTPKCDSDVFKVVTGDLADKSGALLECELCLRLWTLEELTYRWDETGTKQEI